jgi:hypothetical protein
MRDSAAGRLCFPSFEFIGLAALPFEILIFLTLAPTNCRSPHFEGASDFEALHRLFRFCKKGAVLANERVVSFPASLKAQGGWRGNGADETAPTTGD